MELRTQLATLIFALALPAIATAQGFDFGLDLTEEASPPPKASGQTSAKPSSGLNLSSGSKGEFSEGPPVVAVPSARADGGPDVPTYKLLHAGLAELLGARLIGPEATLAAIDSERLDRSALATAEGRERLAEAVGAQKVIVFTAAPARLEAQIFAAPSDEAAVSQTYPWTRSKRIDRARCRTIAKELLNEGKQALNAPPPAAPAVQVATLVSSPEVSETSAPPQDLEAMLRDDIGREESRERPTGAARSSGPLKAPSALILIGAGASLRSLEATSPSSIVPQIPGAMTGLSLDLVLHPLRLVPSLAESWLAGFSVSGDYRRTLTSAQIGDEGESCSVDDDAIVARLSYRHTLGERLPRVGLGLGWASERVNFHCQEPVLSTKYNTIETRLEIAQPLLGEQLGLEVAGGPRFVISETGEGSANSAFAVEGWLSYRPQAVLYVRGGVRITSTKVNTLPENVPTSDLRTFVGVQVGAAL